MKKRHYEDIERQRRIAKRREAARLRNKPYMPYYGVSEEPRLPGHYIIEAPEELSFHSDHVCGTEQFIDKIQYHVSQGKKVQLSFSRTRKVTVLAAMYLFSEIESLYSRDMSKSVYLSHTSLTPFMRHFMCNTGLSMLCNGAPVPDMHSMLPIQRGQKDERCTEITKFVIDKGKHDGWIDTSNEAEIARIDRLVFKALSEAMYNVELHAHPENPDAHQWWATAQIIEDKLFMALCDRGVGIPHTIREGREWAERLGKLLPIKDSELVDIAMRYTRSRTKKSGRGLGTRDMQELILERSHGGLLIVSGRAHYILDGQTGDVLTNSIERKISGTFVQWELPLSKAG